MEVGVRKRFFFVCVRMCAWGWGVYVCACLCVYVCVCVWAWEVRRSRWTGRPPSPPPPPARACLKFPGRVRRRARPAPVAETHLSLRSLSLSFPPFSSFASASPPDSRARGGGGSVPSTRVPPRRNPPRRNRVAEIAKLPGIRRQCRRTASPGRGRVEGKKDGGRGHRRAAADPLARSRRRRRPVHRHPCPWPQTEP